MRTSLAPGSISCALFVAAVLLLASAVARQASAQSIDTAQLDKYAWLEDVNGDKALAWVKEHDARTAAVLEKDPYFKPLEAEAFTVLSSPDRLPYPDFLGSAVYNLWKDSQHLHGIFRRTSMAGYLSHDPKWETVIDYDALSKQDNQSWMPKDIRCLHPEDDRCMIELSAGGEDAVTEREIDLKTGKFVDGGFVLPRGKQSEEWLDKDTLIIARDWGKGTVSESGYPITIRVWKRGQPRKRERNFTRQRERYRRQPFRLCRWRRAPGNDS